jgi:hypothetical protein
MILSPHNQPVLRLNHYGRVRNWTNVCEIEHAAREKDAGRFLLLAIQ